jgi:hypothetical protein
VTVVGDLHLVGAATLAVDLDGEGGEGILRGVGDVTDAVGRLEEVAEDVAVAVPWGITTTGASPLGIDASTVETSTPSPHGSPLVPMTGSASSTTNTLVRQAGSSTGTTSMATPSGRDSGCRVTGRPGVSSAIQTAWVGGSQPLLYRCQAMKLTDRKMSDMMSQHPARESSASLPRLYRSGSPSRCPVSCTRLMKRLV